MTDRALQIAFNTAAHAAAMLAEAPPAGPLDVTWPSFGRDAAAEANQAWAAGLLAPFVRANRDAPPEALYIHARGQAHDVRAAWDVLPLSGAFAYALFALVLTQTDAEIARARAAREQDLRDALPAPPRRPSRDDHALEQLDGVADREVYTDPRLSRRRRRLSLPRKEA